MRKMTMMIAGLLASALMPSAALAGDGNSKASVGYTHYTYSEGNIGLLTARYQYHPFTNIGFEGEVSTGVSGDEIRDGDQTADLEINYSYGAYVVGTLPLDKFGSNIFVRAGYQRVDFELTSGENSVNPPEVNGIGYGAGANIMFNHHHGVRFDYTRLEDDDDFGADTYALSYVLRF